MNNILISGYFGFGNIGDEVILLSEINYLKNIFPQAELTVLSGKPKYTRENFKIKSIYYKNFFTLIKEIKSTDLFISGGGGLLQDETSFRSLLYYLSLIYLAQKFKKKVVVFSQSVGPLNFSLSKFLVQKTLNKVDYIFIRDQSSYQLLQELKIKKRVEIIPDISFYPSPPLNPHLIKGGRGRVKKVGVILKKNYKIYRVLSELIALKNVDIHFLVFYPPDYHLIKKVVQGMPSKTKVIFPTAFNIFNIMKMFDLIVGERLHSLIFSAILNIPFIALGEEEKIVDFTLDILGEKFILKNESSHFLEIYNEIEYNYLSLQEKIKERVAEKNKIIQSMQLKV